MTDIHAIDALLVEDNPYDAELILRALEEYDLGNRAHVVKDGVEALDFVFGRGVYASRRMEDGPKVILLDLKLPKMDGLNVLRKLKSDRCARLIPIVVLTSSEEAQDIVESYRLGANSYVVKPIDSEEFSARVSELGLYWLTCNKTPW